MLQLITRSDIAQYKQISKTPHDDKLKEMILDAQLIDLQPLLGEKLFNKIIASPEEYTELLDGGSYEVDGTTYTNNGLKMVLAYLAYARYMMFSSIIDTPFSVVEKLNDNSRPVEQSNKKTIYTMNRDSAFHLWESVKNYLIRTKNTDFNQHCRPQRQSSGFRIKKLG